MERVINGSKPPSITTVITRELFYACLFRSFEQLGDQYELGNMKPGSTYRTDILFENRSQALATLLVNFHQDRGSTVTVVALNGVELSNPLSKLSFDTHGYVDLGAHINYHTVCMTIEVFIPTTWRDTKAQLQVRDIVL